jgi:hypothetical protein
MLDDKLVLEDVKLIFRNFSGTQTQYNPEGKRNFCVLLDPDNAEKLKGEGWNIRWLEGRMEGEEPQAYMQVAVSFDNYPPQIMLVTKKQQTHLNEDTVTSLDWAEIKYVDLILRPYNWEVNGKKGIKAYLKSMYVTIEEDAFAEKYANMPTDSEPQVRVDNSNLAAAIEDGSL